MAAGRDEDQIAHFLTLEALQEYHYRIFQAGAQLHYIGIVLLLSVISSSHFKFFFFFFFSIIITERPLVSYGSGMATATLRVRDEGNPDFQEHLRNAFTTLFELYGPGKTASPRRRSWTL